MNNKKLLTIIITTYKRPLQLKRCIESIQKNEYLEILVVDDCPEKSGQLITNQYSYINYISKANKSNVANSRNLGINHSNGKYILFLDDDDYLLNNAIDEILQGINCFSNFNFHFFNYLIKDLYGEREKRLSNISLKSLLIVNSIPIGGFVIKKESIKKNFDEKLKTHEDWNFIVDNIEEKSLLHRKKFIVGIDKTTENSMLKDLANYFYDDFLAIYNSHPAPNLREERISKLFKLFNRRPSENELT
jgi:glycosyltransferase involved in cell wall biosynthesis